MKKVITTQEMRKIPLIKVYHVQFEDCEAFETKWIASDCKKKIQESIKEHQKNGWYVNHSFEGECHNTFAVDENHQCDSKSTFKNWI